MILKEVAREFRYGKKDKSKNSKIELMLGKAMYASGMRYIKNDTEILVLKMQKHIGA